MLYSKIEGTGKPLLILHGFLGMSDNWKTLALHYVAAGFQTHCLDLRNHGRSFHSDEFSYEVMAQDVLQYCSLHQLQKCNIIGHSMGGKIAMLLATSHPNLFEKVVIADIGTKYYAPHHQAILAGLNAVDFSLQPSRNEVESVLATYVPDFGTRQFLMKSLYWKTPNQLSFRFNLAVFTAKIDQIGEALPENAVCTLPTLFLRGGNSNYLLASDIAAIQQHFPKAQFETIPNVGHWLHAENPTAFLEHTLLFLQQA